MSKAPVAERFVPVKPNWFHGQASLETRSNGLYPWRIDHAKVELFEQALWSATHKGVAGMPSGVRVSLMTDARAFSLLVGHAHDPATAPAAGACVYDVLVNGKFHRRLTKTDADAPLVIDGLAAGEKRVEIYLPLALGVTVKGARIPAGAKLKPWRDGRSKWLVYGSSITHSKRSHGPSESWPALVARQYDLNMTNLGYGGQCHIDPAVAFMMAKMPADYISLCVGINTYGHASFSKRSFRAAVIGFILTLRTGHPKTPIALVSPILGDDKRETMPNASGMTLQIMREEVQKAAEALIGCGDKNLTFISGLDIVSLEEQAKFMPDKVHPNEEGQWMVAKNFGPAVMKKVFKLKAGAKPKPTVKPAAG